jgi:Cu(I)/Ag(I) efflux system membrane fusion protein
MNKLAMGIAAMALVAAGIGGGYWVAMHRMTAAAAPAGKDVQAVAAGKKPLYWHDPMYPQQKFDKPGKSPFMDMELVPVYGDEASGDSGVSISSRVVQNLGVRTAEATEGTLEQRLETVGAVAFDERSVAVVQARVSGYIERLFARAPLDPVHKGQPLAEIVAPEWAAAQEEYLALRNSTLADGQLRHAARQRLVLIGMPQDAIAALEASGRPQARITLTAPISGVIAELGAREGMSVMPGAMLFRINGLATVWVNAEIPEAQAALVRTGARVEATVPAYPGEKFSGRVAAILPEVNPATRTLKARIELGNREAKLTPGMFATVDLSSKDPRRVVLVPSEAVIRTGQRTVVVIADIAQDGRQQFKPIDVEIGAEAKGKTEVRKGIRPGVKVVTSGQFLIDSEASLKASESRMSDPGGTPGQAPK